MTKHNSSKAQYFNSHSPIPLSGTFWIYTTNALFIPDTEAKQFPKITIKPEEIRIVSTLEDSIHIETHDPTDPDRSRVFVLEDISLLETVKKFSQQKKVTAHSHFMQGLFSLSLYKKLLIAAIVVPVASFCILTFFENAHLFVPTTFDAKIGEPVGEQIAGYYEVCDDPALNKTLNTLLTKFQPSSTEYNFKVTILSDPQANAFAVPGGGIYIFSGLLEESESLDEVAGILAHEMGHIVERHGIKAIIRSSGSLYLMSILIGTGLERLESAETISELAGTLLFLSYSRDAEHKADIYAVNTLNQHAVSLNGLKQFFQRSQSTLESNNTMKWIRTHPRSSQRVEFLQQEKNKQAANLAPLMKVKQWDEIKQGCKIK